jgi:hypothetical protein
VRFDGYAYPNVTDPPPKGKTKPQTQRTHTLTAATELERIKGLQFRWMLTADCSR